MAGWFHPSVFKLWTKHNSPRFFGWRERSQRKVYSLSHLGAWNRSFNFIVPMQYVIPTRLQGLSSGWVSLGWARGQTSGLIWKPPPPLKWKKKLLHFSSLTSKRLPNVASAWYLFQSHLRSSSLSGLSRKLITVMDRRKKSLRYYYLRCWVGRVGRSASIWRGIFGLYPLPKNSDHTLHQNQGLFCIAGTFYLQSIVKFIVVMSMELQTQS